VACAAADDLTARLIRSVKVLFPGRGYNNLAEWIYGCDRAHARRASAGMSAIQKVAVAAPSAPPLRPRAPRRFEAKPIKSALFGR
jgi:hypothetical protein